MDSLSAYVDGAARGGPAGEILIRENLQRALVAMGGVVDVAGSDADFFDLTRDEAQGGDKGGRYQLYFLDPWTYVGPGWVPRPFLPGREGRTFLLSFFGMKEVQHGLEALPLPHVLNPYPVSGTGNSFLGYPMAPRWRGTVTQERGPGGSVHLVPALPPGEDALLPVPPPKRRQAVVWGKQPTYFEGRWEGLARLAGALHLQLHFTVPDLPPEAVRQAAAIAAAPPSPAPHAARHVHRSIHVPPAAAHPAAPAAVHVAAPGAAPAAAAAPTPQPLLVAHGHLSRGEWATLLAQSAFMLGLGDPLSGPSAVDAVAAGTAFLNPAYAEPKQGGLFTSQHPFLAERVGAPYVCGFSWDDWPSLLRCANSTLERALSPEPLRPLVPGDLTPRAYATRVGEVIGSALEAQGVRRLDG